MRRVLLFELSGDALFQQKAFLIKDPLALPFPAEKGGAFNTFVINIKHVGLVFHEMVKAERISIFTERRRMKIKIDTREMNEGANLMTPERQVSTYF